MQAILLCRRAAYALLAAWYLTFAAEPVHAATSESSTNVQRNDEGIVQDLGTLLQRQVARDEFSGAALLAKGDSVLFERAYGHANRAFYGANQLDTKFNLGSMSKMFTAVCILKLAQEGKLSLEDTLLQLVPGYPDREIAAKIKVKHLLTHTSGLGDFFNEKFRKSSRGAYRTTQSHVPLFVGEPLQFEPGTRFAYSNSGFIVLGLIIEQVSERSYYEYVREHVFKPAGMMSTDNYSADEDVPNLALGYTRMGPDGPGDPREPRHTNILMHVARGSAAGGAYSTVGDMLRFARALLGYKLLDKQHTELMLTGKVETPRGDKYAYGIAESVVNGVRIVGHGGGFAGISGRLDMYPALGYTVVVLSNYDAGAEGVSDRLRWTLTGGSVPRAVQLPSQTLQRFAGRYAVAVPPGSSPLPPIEVVVDGDALIVATRMRRRFLPLSVDEFFDETYPGDRLKFTKNSRGQNSNLTIQRADWETLITATLLP